MTKPTKKIIECWDYSECTKYIEQRHKIDTRDFARAHHQFSEWCEANGEKQILSEKDIKGAQKQFARYQADIASGKVTKRPYQDFWHWIIEHLNPNRGGFIELSNEDLDCCDEDWQRDILELYLSEFGEGAERHIKFHTDW